MGKLRFCALTIAISLALIVATSEMAVGHEESVHQTARATVRVQVFGDSTAFTLAFGLAGKSLASRYGYTLDNEGNIGCGLVVGPTVRAMGKAIPTSPACNGSTPDGTPLTSEPPLFVKWQAAMSKFHPNVVVLLAGRWEVADRVYEGAWTNILNPTFAAYVKHLLELASNLVTATGANLVFMTSPCVHEATQPDGTPYPESDPNRIAIYNQLVRQVAAEHPTTDSVIDLNALVCRGGKFTPTYKGVQIRTADGIHFTEQAGGVLGPVLMPQMESGRAQMARVR
jgi:SGNH domain (fused to AT3 domains)